ncbi:MAG TPA: NAD-dependent succinate-semialdehyde dehydrogenase [Candidatus Nanoarchaeia archaeon]|nr:NAD-dependent succinate-semialdehyde dehydrogenase [Candidatus Nanoarchaeia archaeon]
MKFTTTNPSTEEVIGEHETDSKEQISSKAKKANKSFSAWKSLSISERGKYMLKLASVIRKNSRRYAEIATLEMGKPIAQSLAEVEKCALTAEVYAASSEKWLEDEIVQADGKKHLVTFKPIGTVLSIMPWNFPYWQVYRFAIPALMSGNVSILKHSNIVPECALAIEDSFSEARFPEGVFQAVISEHGSVKELVSSEFIHGVSLTGSTEVGSRIAELCGKNIKKCVLELGGSDPFIVLKDADVENAAMKAVKARILNSGQSCIAAKRIIVERSIADEFTKKFANYMEALKVGDPFDMETEVGPLASKSQLLKIESQVADAVSKRGKILAGGKRLPGKGYFYAPTVIADTSPKMRVVSEEVFGPVAPVIVARNEKEALEIANDTEYGLGASVWTKDEKKGIEIAKKLEAGMVFVNGVVKSDPRMPFGGIKKSGLGRELSKYGLMEFVNIKTINLY